MAESSPDSKSTASLKELSELQRDLFSTSAALPFRKKDNKVTTVLLVGITGAGKTTLLHSLVGKKLYGTDIGSIVLEPKPEDLLSAISHNADAGTVIPNEMEDESHGLRYFDCPGFLDPDMNKRIIHAFTMDQLLQPPCKIKILLVLSYFDVLSRGKLANQAFDVLTNFVPCAEELEQAIGCILTQTPETIDPVKFLDNRLKSESKRNPLIDHLIAHPEKIFTFPAAVSEGEYTLFDDKDRLIKFFQTKPVKNPGHRFSLDNAAVNGYLIPLTKILRDNMTRTVNDVFCQVTDFGNRSTSSSRVKQCLDGLTKLEKAAKKGWAPFASACEKFKTWSDELKQLVDGIQCFGKWIDYLAPFKEGCPGLEQNYEFSFEQPLESLIRMKGSLQRRYDEQRDAEKAIESEEFARSIKHGVKHLGEAVEASGEAMFSALEVILPVLVVAGPDMIKLGTQVSSIVSSAKKK